MTKLTVADVRRVVMWLRRGVKHILIARWLKCSTGAVSCIASGRTHRKVTKEMGRSKGMNFNRREKQ